MKQPEVDNHKLMYHPDRVAEWKKKGDCYPVYVEIGPTNRCNHKCVFCALDWLEHGVHDIEKEVMISTLKDLSINGVESVMFAGEGEPLLHKDIGYFVQTANKQGMDVSITTNGVAFTESKREECLPYLKWIRFSVDAGTPESYARIHRTISTDFERVIKNIKDSVEYRNKNGLETTIGVQFLMVSQSIGEANKLANILKEIGADNLQIKPYSHHPDSSNDLLIDSGIYNQIEEGLMKFNSDKFKILFRRATIERLEEKVDYPKCYGLPFFALIDSKGNVLPCNLFYNNEEFTYGNLYKQSFSEIWEGDRRKEVLQKLDEQGVSECRKGCRLDVINRYLHRLKNPHPHDKFL